MSRHRTGLAPLPWVAALLLLAAPASPARGLDLEVEVGLDGLVVDGAWTPVAVRCTLGAGEPALDGRVVLVRPRDTVTRIEAPLHLAPGTSATVRLTAPAAPGMTWTVRVVDAAGATRAEAVPAGSLTLLLPEERLVVVCGPVGAAALGSGPSADRPRLARLRPHELPRDPHALAAASAVVLAPGGGVEHVELARDPAVAAALERYVRGGGTLLLLPGQGAFWTGSPLEALAPARVEGLGDEPSGALEPLVGGIDPPRPVPVLTCTPREGARVLAAGERHALLVERRLGRGRVALLAFDPDRDGVRGAERAPAFLLGLLDLGGAKAPPPFRAGDAEALLAETLQATPLLGSAWFYLLAVAAAAHVAGLSLVTAAVARRRGPWAGLALPPIISVGLAAGLLAAGALGRGEARVTALVLEVHEPQESPDPAPSLHAALAVVARGRTSAWVELPDALRPEPRELSGLDLLRPGGRAAALRDRAGKPALVGPLEVSAPGRAALLVGGRAPLAADAPLRGGPRLRARVTPYVPDPQPGRSATPELWPQVDVENATDEPVEGAHVLALGPSGARLVPLPPLGPGQRLHLTTTPEHALLAGPAAPAGDPDLPAARAALVERVARRLEGAWIRAVSASASQPAHFPTAWVLHARVEPGTFVPVLQAEDGPSLAGRTVRVTCVAAEGP